MKRICLAVLFCIGSHIYAADWVLQGYLPSFFGFVCSGGAIIYQFEDREIDKRMIIPFEAKIVATKLGPVALSGNAMLSLYFENAALSSINTSTGISISAANRFSSPLSGLYFTFYPMYEFPVIAFGKKPLMTWKAATDLGIGISLTPTPLYFSIYGRMIYYWRGSDFSLTPPDVGITIGWHFQEKTNTGKVKRP
jgi:hypothetical protein